MVAWLQLWSVEGCCYVLTSSSFLFCSFDYVLLCAHIFFYLLLFLGIYQWLQLWKAVIKCSHGPLYTTQLKHSWSLVIFSKIIFVKFFNRPKHSLSIQIFRRIIFFKHAPVKLHLTARLFWTLHSNLNSTTISCFSIPKTMHLKKSAFWRRFNSVK